LKAKFKGRCPHCRRMCYSTAFYTEHITCRAIDCIFCGFPFNMVIDKVQCLACSTCTENKIVHAELYGEEE